VVLNQILCTPEATPPPQLQEGSVTEGKRNPTSYPLNSTSYHLNPTSYLLNPTTYPLNPTSYPLNPTLLGVGTAPAEPSSPLMPSRHRAPARAGASSTLCAMRLRPHLPPRLWHQFPCANWRRRGWRESQQSQNLLEIVNLRFTIFTIYDFSECHCSCHSRIIKYGSGIRTLVAIRPSSGVQPACTRR
jgi:hypothetical protein